MAAVRNTRNAVVRPLLLLNNGLSCCKKLGGEYNDRLSWMQIDSDIDWDINLDCFIRERTMNGYEFILQKQLQWAHNNNMSEELVGSAIDKGRRVYTKQLELNLFQSLMDNVRREFNAADGNEIVYTKEHAAKMSALHSSSALCVNIFQYWLKTNRINEIAYMCGFCEEFQKSAANLQFEKKLSIQRRFTKCPNIDVFIENNASAAIRVYAIESKFTEPYANRGHNGLGPKYLPDEEAWDDIPNIFELGKRISPKDNEFVFLHAAQLIKHILALKKCIGNKKGFRLLYLWYDTIGEESF